MGFGRFSQSAGPDFVMLGLPHKDGVIIYASRTLAGCQLEWEQEMIRVDRWPGDFPQSIAGPQSFTITAYCGEVTAATGADYAEAFANLFRSWQPKPAASKALPPADLALPAPASADDTDWDYQAGRGGW